MEQIGRLLLQQWNLIMTAATKPQTVEKTMSESIAWDIYFGSICAMAFHPGNLHNEIDLQKLADLCDTMILIRRERCPLSQQES